jgi:hypothetical protein
LGTVEAHHDGQPIPLGRRQERCLLGVMLLEPIVAEHGIEPGTGAWQANTGSAPKPRITKGHGCP